jgi:hypothetical protein
MYSVRHLADRRTQTNYSTAIYSEKRQSEQGGTEQPEPASGDPELARTCATCPVIDQAAGADTGDRGISPGQDFNSVIPLF